VHTVPSGRAAGDNVIGSQQSDTLLLSSVTAPPARSLPETLAPVRRVMSAGVSTFPTKVVDALSVTEPAARQNTLPFQPPLVTRTEAFGSVVSVPASGKSRRRWDRHRRQG
jgi:hypothetical protein